jgi:C-terminal processing protease CtpA/Prc
MATIPEMFYLSRMPRFLATLLALQTLSAFAAHHRVSPPASIQTAINTAKAGDTIELGPGIWRENLLIEKSLTLKGAGWNRTTLELPGSTEPTFEATLRKLLAQLEALPLPERQPFMRTNRFIKSPAPLQITGAHQVELMGLSLRWRGPNADHRPVIDQLVDIDKADARMRNVAVLGSPGDGVLVHNGASLEMTDCLVAGHRGTGVMIGAKDEPVRRAHLIGCEIRNNYATLVSTFHHARDVRIENCDLHGTAFFALRANATGSVITGNHIRDIPRPALYCPSPASLIISNNLFVSAGAAAFWKAGGDTFIRNTIIARDSPGLLSINEANPVVTANLFHACDIALNGSFSSGAKPGDDTGRFDLRGNWYSNNRTNHLRALPASGENKSDLKQLPVEKDARHGDPGFVNAENGDFRLRADAPARLAGIGALIDRKSESRFQIQAEETSIIPDGDSFDFSRWQKPARVDVEWFIPRAQALMNPPKPNPVSYSEAFRDLHETLGRQYPNFELKGIDWAAVGRELIPRGETIKDDRQFALLCYELGARLQDSHVSFSKGTLDPPLIDFPRWDPGFACLKDGRGLPVVYHVDTNGPAFKAGIRPGDTIDAIDDHASTNAVRFAMEFLSRWQGYSSERNLRHAATRFFHRRDKQGQDVRLKITSADGAQRDLVVPAEMAARYLPRLPVPTPGIEDVANVSWTRLPGNIGLIYVRRIRDDLIGKLDAAVADLHDAKGLILDVRGNSGGGFDARRAHVNFAGDLSLDPERPRFTGPVALLIDEACISAGEGWASWFIAKERARVFGSTTAGASARKTTYELKNGLLKITFPVKPYRGFLDRVIERRGLEPDVPVRQSAHDLAQGRDTVRSAAVAWLTKQYPPSPSSR